MSVEHVLLDDTYSPRVDLRERDGVVIDLTDRGRQVGPSEHCRYRGWRLSAKRLMDVVIAAVAIVVLSPVLLALALAVKLGSRGPALFSQTRIGRHGRRFTIYKFRTMRSDAEDFLASHPELAEAHRRNDFKLDLGEDVRVTRIGRFLRKTSLDELPQLFNIVKGDMSLVGPRPVVPDEIVEYRQYRDMYELAMPGLTGVWQASGREAVRYPERARLDADYIEDFTLAGDIAIMARTFGAVISR